MGPLGPLDEAGLTSLKAQSTAAALAYLNRFAAQDGVSLNSATGQWISCRDEGSDFGEYTVNARINRVRREHAVFQRLDNVTVLESAHESLFVFAKGRGADTIIRCRRTLPRRAETAQATAAAAR